MHCIHGTRVASLGSQLLGYISVCIHAHNCTATACVGGLINQEAGACHSGEHHWLLAASHEAWHALCIMLPAVPVCMHD